MSSQVFPVCSVKKQRNHLIEIAYRPETRTNPCKHPVLAVLLCRLFPRTRQCARRCSRRRLAIVRFCPASTRRSSPPAQRRCRFAMAGVPKQLMSRRRLQSHTVALFSTMLPPVARPQLPCGRGCSHRIFSIGQPSPLRPRQVRSTRHTMASTNSALKSS
jgi:hypothetical protein